MKKNKFIILILSLIAYSGCNNKERNVRIDYFSTGYPKRINIFQNENQTHRKEFLYYENGNVKSISNYVNDLKEGEQLNFHEIKGSLESKLIFKKNMANGVAYWFYESGALKSSRNYQNDKQWYLGFDYWDDSFVINKALLRFDDNAKIYYKMNFDTSGNFISDEGKER